MEKLSLLIALGLTCAINAQQWTNYTSSDGLIEGIISNMIIDDSDKLWFVDWSNGDNPGIGNFDGTNWQTFGPADGTASNRYQGMIQDANGVYWFGSFLFEDGLDRFDGTTWQNFTVDDGLAGNVVSDIITGNDGALWMVCRGNTAGLTRYSDGVFTSFPADGTTLPATPLVRLDQADDDVLWIATNLEGVLAFDGVDYVQYTMADGLSSNTIESLFIDSSGIVWAGADIADNGGLNRFDGSSWTVFTTLDGLPEDSIRAIFEDSSGNLWFGTNAGISRYDGTEFVNFDSSDGLIEDHVRAIVEDADGNLWFGTWGGISKFNPTLGAFETLKEAFSLYPNPTSGILQIQSEAQISEVRVYSMLGAQVARKEVTHIAQIDLSKLTQGAYWVKVITSSDKVGFKKVIIE